ncbi:MAG: DmsE family decaheme c-type cytochrome [Gammaproteobacteria bacterium]|nr:DmsE family decaheme c-type cytochrome [Gammaproteobacteria bacterium]
MSMFETIIRQRALCLALLVAMGAVSPQLYAADDDDDGDAVIMTAEQADEAVLRVLNAPSSDKGADSCLKCHDEDNEYPVMPLFKTRHATATDPRTPFANQQCETCHGPGGEHQKESKKGEEKAPILNFGKNVWTPAKAQNERCLSCHQNHERIEWKGSSHEFNEVACASCHRIHVTNDPMLDKKQQADVCYTCHVNKRAKFFQVSRHPVREGQMSCSDCHNAHAEDGDGIRVAATVREKCTSCHAEKRGPFLWEHQPAAEDCAVCHTPHGSNFPALLKKRPPQLCQQCHAQAGHPSVSYNGSVVPSQFLSVKGCLNCHSNTHGSNHPSGASSLR